VSALFLMAIALANVGILITTCQALSAATRGQSGLEDRLAALPSPRGMLGACLQPLFKLISASWHMYPLSFLFGLGFDTATEIGVLGISAAQGATALPLWSIMVFPALFTAGMSLVDTLDGILIVGAYGWALVKPVRKLYYNLTVTLLSVLLAVLIGGAEALELLVQGLHLEATFASFSTAIANNSGMLGYLIVGTFVASWLLSLGIYRLNVDKIR
jgi:nickel/cobalt transporter (NiCoT) family protein